MLRTIATRRGPRSSSSCPFFTMKAGTVQLTATISPSTVRRIGTPTAYTSRRSSPMLAQKPRARPDVHGREQRIADRQHRRAELVLAQAHVVAQVAELGEGVGEPRNRGLGQAGAHRDFLVAEQRLERREAAQHFQAAREGGGELAVGPLALAKSALRGKRARTV